MDNFEKWLEKQRDICAELEIDFRKEGDERASAISHTNRQTFNEVIKKYKKQKEKILTDFCNSKKVSKNVTDEFYGGDGIASKSDYVDTKKALIAAKKKYLEGFK